MKKFFAIAISVVMILGIMASCGDDDTSSSVSHIGGSDAPTDILVSETVSYEVIDPVALGDTLTAEIEGDWKVAGVYQAAKVSDRDEATALAQEKSKAVHIGSDFFEYFGARVDVPYYKFVNVTAQDLSVEGFANDKIQADFANGTQSLEVYEENGTDLVAIFYVKGDELVYFGAGGYIFTCAKTAAVG